MQVMKKNMIALFVMACLQFFWDWQIFSESVLQTWQKEALMGLFFHLKDNTIFDFLSLTFCQNRMFNISNNYRVTTVQSPYGRTPSVTQYALF